MGLIVLLAISVSLDTFGVGMAYAMSGVKIPWNTRLIISAVNLVFTAAAVFASHSLNGRIPGFWFRLAGGGILLFIGARTLWNALGENRTKDYDKDESSSIEPAESIMLSLSLTMDSVCAGLGIGGNSLWEYLFPVMTAAANLIFFSLGSLSCCNLRKINGFAGCILIILGLFRFVCGS